jgi:hypothetical protein
MMMQPWRAAGTALRAPHAVRHGRRWRWLRRAQ